MDERETPFTVRPSFMRRFCLGPAVSSSCVAGRDRTRPPPAGDLGAGASSFWTLENFLSVAESRKGRRLPGELPGKRDDPLPILDLPTAAPKIHGSYTVGV